MTTRLLLGGSFNPVHEGHLQLAKKASAHYDGCPVTFIPNYMNPLKGQGTSAEHRLNMLRLCVSAPYDICTFEVEKEGTSFTVDTLEYLTTTSDDDFVWLMGADCLVHFHLWKNVTRLLELCRIQLFTRPRSVLEAPDELIEMVGEKQVKEWIDNTLELDMPYSSTQARQAVMHGEKPAGISDKVYRYIVDNRLYD